MALKVRRNGRTDIPVFRETLHFGLLHGSERPSNRFRKHSRCVGRRRVLIGAQTASLIFLAASTRAWHVSANLHKARRCRSGTPKERELPIAGSRLRSPMRWIITVPAAPRRADLHSGPHAAPSSGPSDSLCASIAFERLVSNGTNPENSIVLAFGATTFCANVILP